MYKDNFVEKFHNAMRRLDIEELSKITAEDVSIFPPTFWKKVSGKKNVLIILEDVFSSIDDFTYDRHWKNKNDYVFEFSGTVEGKGIQGVDIVSINDDEKIQEILVMIRPINTLVSLMQIVKAKHGDKLDVK